MIMLRILLFSLITMTVMSIRFNYYLQMYQIQCFHQSVEKDSRYQISIKGQTSLFYLHVVDKKPLHQDMRTINAQYKYYSAFAQNNQIVTFCIGNIGDKPIYFDVQFYHGIFLQDSFQEKIQGHQLQDLTDRWNQMLKMIESNYDTYKNHIFERRISSKRINMILALMVAIIIIGTLIIKLLYYRKIVGYLRQKKAV